MIAVATGNSVLNRQILSQLKKNKCEGKIINLKDDFLKENFQTVIISKNLEEEELGLEQLFYYLSQNSSRVIYTIDSSNSTEISMCFKYDIYDIVFEPTADKVIEALETEKTLSDWSKHLNRESGLDLQQQLEEMQQLRIKEKKRFENEIKELKKKLEEESNKEPVVVEKRVEVPFEVQVIVEKTVENRIEVLSNSNIAVISNISTGKSFITWNLAHGFAERKYDTTVLCLDRGYSANINFGISPEDYSTDLLDIDDKVFQLEDKSYYAKEKLRIICGALAEDESINSEKFIKIWSSLQANSEVNIFDCRSEVDELSKLAITHSNMVLVIFDMDMFHLHMNMKMLEEFKEILNPKKTIAVINNIFTDSKEVKNIRNVIESYDFKFKKVCQVCNAGVAAYDAKYTDRSPYMISKDKEFIKDIDNLFIAMQAKEKKRSLVSKLLKIKGAK